MYDVTEAPMDPLTLLAEQVSTLPTYLPHDLAAHRPRFGLTEAEQRRHLGVTVTEWPVFKLCGMPETEEDLQAVADRFGADRERLERALKGGE